MISKISMFIVPNHVIIEQWFFFTVDSPFYPVYRKLGRSYHRPETKLAGYLVGGDSIRSTGHVGRIRDKVGAIEYGSFPGTEKWFFYFRNEETGITDCRCNFSRWWFFVSWC